MATRLFLMGAVLLFFGGQLRTIDTFVLNEQVTRIVNKRFAPKPAIVEQSELLSAGLYDPLFDTAAKVVLPARREITPPRWLGWSLLSMGAVLVLTCPLCRR